MNADVLKAAYYAMAAVVREAKGRAAMARANGLVWAKDAELDAEVADTVLRVIGRLCAREGVDVG